MMKNLTKKAWIALMVLLFFMAITPTALAVSEDDASEEENSSFWDDVKSAGSNLYQSAKEHAPGWWQSVKDTASSAKDTVKEHGPEWVETAQEKGLELLDKGAGVLQSAGEQVSGFLEDQQNQFWERTEQQIYGGSAPSSTPDDASDSGEATASQNSDNPSAAGASSNDVDEPSEAGASQAPQGADMESSGSATAEPETPSPAVSAAPESSAPAGEDEGGWTIVVNEPADEQNANEPAGDDAQEHDATLTWVAISLGLAAIACGSLYVLRTRPKR